MLLNIPYKSGKIQVTEDGSIQAVQPFGRVLWQARCQDVTGLVTQPGAMMAVNVTIQATSGPYMAEMVTRANYEKLQKALPHIESQRAGSAWYESPTALTHIATYTKEKDMQRDLEAAYQFGWMVQGQSGQSGHVNVGRTAGKLLLTGGLGLLTGVSRSKDKTTITFVRSPEWMAKRQ